MEGGQYEIEQKRRGHAVEIPSSSMQLEMQIFQEGKKHLPVLQKNRRACSAEVPVTTMNLIPQTPNIKASV